MKHNFWRATGRIGNYQDPKLQVQVQPLAKLKRVSGSGGALVEVPSSAQTRASSVVLPNPAESATAAHQSTPVIVIVVIVVIVVIFAA